MKNNIMEIWEKKGVKFVPSASGDGGVILNSCLISGSKDITLYVRYLLHESEFTSHFDGSVEGFVFEWTVHNIAYQVYKDPEKKERAKDLNVGRTIYDDAHGIESKMMLRAFEVLYPKQAKKDKAVHSSKNPA